MRLTTDWDTIVIEEEFELPVTESCDLTAPSIDTRLSTKSTDIIEQVVDSDPVQTKALINAFNMNEAKRNMLRLNKLNTLYGHVTDQMLQRIEARPDNFSNDDLVKFAKVTQDAIKSASDMVAKVTEEPAIQINNNLLNVVNNTNAPVDGLSRESKNKITNAVKAILAKTNSQTVIDADTTDVDDE